jgi:hypothetical protein
VLPAFLALHSWLSELARFFPNNSSDGTIHFFLTEAAYLADSQYADVEALVLSGELFNGTSRSSSPSRSITADDDDRGWHDDEYIAGKQKEFNEKGLDYDSDAERRDMIKSKEQQEMQLQQSIGMGPGRTGVKGVIRDRDEAAQIQREKKAKEMEELKQKMEATNLGGKTFLEEEWEKVLRGEKADKLVTMDFERLRERMETFGGKAAREVRAPERGRVERVFICCRERR